MKKFNIEEFKKEFSYGDIFGIDYIEKTIIEEMKKENKESKEYTKQDYIIDLFSAVKMLNSCNDIYETTKKANNFDYNLYFESRDLLFKELGILEKLEMEIR